MFFSQKKNKINLLPQDSSDTSTFGRILVWATSSFRIMVIIVELVVITAFLSRFWLDAKNSNLNKEIDNKKAQILAYSNIESQIRLYQNKLNRVESLNQQKEIGKIIASIPKFMPEDIKLSSISINNDALTLLASSFSEQSIMQFLVNLDSNENLNDVNLSQITSSVENEYEIVFTITANIKTL